LVTTCRDRNWIDRHPRGDSEIADSYRRSTPGARNRRDLFFINSLSSVLNGTVPLAPPVLQRPLDVAPSARQLTYEEKPKCRTAVCTTP
jgi:hypothetical protein